MATCQDCKKEFQPRQKEVVCPVCWKIESDSIDELYKQTTKKEDLKNG